MKKLIKQKGLPPFRKRERLKVYIKLDRHLQRLHLSGLLKEIRETWDIPETGFKSVTELEKWQEEKLWSSKDGLEKWQKTLQKALDCANLSEIYLNTVENFITLNIHAADVDLPDIPNYRTDINYLRAQKLIEFSKSIDPVTGRRITAQEVADLYNPRYPLLTLSNSSDPKWENKFKIKKPNGEDYAQPINEFPVEKYDKWLDQFGVFTGNQVRKIISKHKRRLLK